MSDIVQEITFPLDVNGFFRRECPLCVKEFKVLLENNEINDLAQKFLDSFMVEQEELDDSISYEYSETEYNCPYCGQKALENSWWTQEQIAYISIFAQNILAEMVNENIIRPMKKMSRSNSSALISIEFEGKEIQKQEPWISPEINDMKIFELKCCKRKIKIDDNWSKKVYCFFCGFPHVLEIK